MTNGRGAGMASFMTKKKKYKFQVDICLEELLEVPFVSAVLFAKLRLLDGGNFQDHSSREEVKDHKVKWGAKFSFPCKMMANASTGVLERCILRISVRKESKGGRSFNKLGYVDLNLAEYAGAGVTYKKALLEGYDTRHRQDNSMIKFTIALNMLSGDILFKVPSSVTSEDPATEQKAEDFSSGSLGGSIASGSSGFGSLPKKRPALLTSDLVIGQTLTENNYPISIASDMCDTNIQQQQQQQNQQDYDDINGENGHSRNSSNTSQLSKASGYSSVHSYSHSRQSSSGDSGHIRGIPQRPIRKTNITKVFSSNTTPPKIIRMNTYPSRIQIPNTIYSPSLSPAVVDEVFLTPKCSILNHNDINFTSTKSMNNSILDESFYFTPNSNYKTQFSTSNDEEENFKTPNETLVDDFENNKIDLFSKSYNELKKSSSTSVVERLKVNSNSDIIENRNSEPVQTKNIENNLNLLVLRSKSDFEIPRISPIPVKKEKRLTNLFLKSDSLYSFLTPRLKRKDQQNKLKHNSVDSNNFKIPNSKTSKQQNIHSLPETRTTSLNSLQSMTAGNGNQLIPYNVKRNLPHRKLLEGSSGGKLAPLALTPDETPAIVSSDLSQNPTIRRPSVTTNPSSSSLVLSETGSLDRAKAAYERRKKVQSQDSESGTIPGRVEITRVNPDHLIEELLKNTNLETADDSAESSGLQLFIAKDGTASLGNHEVKSQMSTGVQVFKQVVMDDR